MRPKFTGPTSLRSERPREIWAETRAEPIPENLSRTFQAAMVGYLSTQGISLRPKPWAKVCRPVGPLDCSVYLPWPAKQSGRSSA
jgi:hypothetical protein